MCRSCTKYCCTPAGMDPGFTKGGDRGECTVWAYNRGWRQSPQEGLVGGLGAKKLKAFCLFSRKRGAKILAAMISPYFWSIEGGPPPSPPMPGSIPVLQHACVFSAFDWTVNACNKLLLFKMATFPQKHWQQGQWLLKFFQCKITICTLEEVINNA